MTEQNTTPDRPSLGDVDEHGRLPGWEFVMADRGRQVLCGWTDDGTFVTFADCETIARAFADALIELHTAR